MRPMLVSLLLHLALIAGATSLLHWQPQIEPGEPAHIELLLGLGQPSARPDPARAASEPMAGPISARRSPAAETSPAAAAAAGWAAPMPDARAGVRVDEHDPTITPARADPGNPGPAFPEEAARQGLQGRVLLRLHIDAGGAVTDVETLRSSGHAVLDEAAVAALRRWHFSPARRGGVPIASFRDQPVDYLTQQQD